jgi:hypothetical protein
MTVAGVGAVRDTGGLASVALAQVSPNLQRAIEGLGLQELQLRLREDLLDPAAAAAGGGGGCPLLECLTTKMEAGPVLLTADDWDDVGELLLGEDCSECRF